MRKTKILCAFLLTISLHSFAQNEFNSHWSITLEGGINKFDGDVRQAYNNVIPTALNQISFGGSLEYTITPVWSMGLEYYYLPYRASDPDGHYYLKNGKMHSVDYFMAFNLQKMFLRNSKSKWGIWATLGGGLASYNASYITDGSSTPNNQNYPDVSTDVKNGLALTIPVGVLIEYNFSKNFALGTKIQYRAYNKDNLDGRNYRGVTNDFLELATLQLRWKFKAKNHYHTRNINLAQFDDDITRDELKDMIDKLQKQIDEKPTTPIDTDKIDDLNNRLQKLEDYLDIDGPDDDNDGVANSRDKEPNTPKSSMVNFWGQTIDKNKGQEKINEHAYIYFDFDKTNLDSEAIKAIQIATEKLKADPDLMIEVRGYTDNMGNNAYNQDLSQRRADKVKNEFVTVYGIDKNRIIANGKGKFDPQDKIIPYRPYRTCVLFYSK